MYCFPHSCFDIKELRTKINQFISPKLKIIQSVKLSAIAGTMLHPYPPYPRGTRRPFFCTPHPTSFIGAPNPLKG